MIREILFKNLSSADRKRKVFLTCVINKGEDYVSTSERKYIYLIKRIKQKHKTANLETHIFVRNERNSNKNTREFNCLLKGSFYAYGSNSLFLIRYAQSLKIVRKGLIL